MPEQPANEVVALHRQSVPYDNRDDAQLTLAYGDSPNGPALMQKYPQFGAQYQQLASQRKSDMTPTVGQEFAGGVSSGADSLLSSAYGAAGLAAGAVRANSVRNFLLQKAQENEEAAAENPPSVPSVSDISDFSSGARYIARKAGELVPNVAEAGVTAAVGAAVGGAAGTAAEPGGGTILGTAGGAITGLIEKQAVKSLIRKGVVAGLEDLASAEGQSLLKKETLNLGRTYGTHIAETLNFWGQSAGSTYNTLSKDPNVDPDTAINVAFFGGLAQAVPAQYLPSTITKKFFGGEAAAIGPYYARLGSQAAKIIPGGAAAMSMQELASIASEKFANPNTRADAFNLSKWTAQDRTRLLDASATGGLAGLIGAPIAALPAGKAHETDAALKNYTGQQSPEAMQQLQEIAQRDAAGTLTPQDQSTIKNLTPEQHNAYTLVKEQAQKEPEPSPVPTVEEKSDLGPVTDRITENPSPLVQHPELSDNDILKAIESKSPAPEPPTSTASVPLMVTREMEQGLADLGYSKADRDSMTPQQANDVLAKGMRKSVPQPEPQVFRQPEQEPGSPADEHGAIYGPKLNPDQVANFKKQEGQEFDLPSPQGTTTTLKVKSNKLWVQTDRRVGNTLEHEVGVAYLHIGPDGTTVLDASKHGRSVDKLAADQLIQFLQKTASSVPASQTPAPVMGNPITDHTALASARARAVEALSPEALETRQNVAQAAAETKAEPPKPETPTSAKPKVEIDGIPIAMENAAGGTRTGKAGDWQVEMPAHYGEIVGSKGADGDPIDVYVGPKPEGHKVYVIDQRDPETGVFDEHKVMMGFDSQREAESAYDAAFSDGKGPARRGAVTETTKDGLKEWLKNGDATKPFAQETKADRIGIDDIDFENTNLVSRESKQGRRGGEATKFEPSYFEIKPSESQDTKALGEKLVSGSRSQDQKRAYQESKRVTAVHDNETGKVYLLSTYREKTDGSVKMADPAKVNAKGKTASRATRIEEFLAQKTADGTDKYTPFASLRMKDTERYLVQEYPDRETFDHEIGNESQQRMGTIGSHAQVIEELHDAGMQERGQAQPDAQGYDEADGIPEEGAAEPETKDAEEGFTLDHANALWNVFGGEEEGTLTRERFEELFSSDLTKSRRAIDAIGVIVRSIMEHNELSAEDALDLAKEKLYETLEIGDQSGKKAYAESALQKFGSAAASDARGGGDGSQTAQASAQQRTAEQQQKGAGRNEIPNNPSELRFRKPEGVQEVTGQHADLLDSIHKAALEGGLNIQKFARDITGASGEFGKRTGAVFDRASRTVAQVVCDVIGREDIVTSLHEVGHDVFSRLPEAQRNRILSAIDRLSDRQLGVELSSDPRIRTSNPDSLSKPLLHEERLVEAVAQRLTEEGFHPYASRGFAQTFVRALKDLYLRAAMMIQRALFGDDFANPAMAQRFFENRVKMFLAGDFNRSSFVDTMGGGKPSDAKAASWHANGSQTFERVGESGNLEYQHVPDTSLEASSLNNRVFRRPDEPVVSDPHSREVEVEKRAALFNHQREMFERAAEHPDIVKLAKEQKEMSPKERLFSLLNLTDPDKMKQALQSELEQDKTPVQFNASKTIEEFKAKSNQADVTRTAYQNVQAIVSKVSRIKNDAREAVEKLTDQRTKKLERYEKIKAEYADWQSSTTEATQAMRKEGNKLFAAIAGTSKKQGIIEQQLRALDPQADLKKYGPAFQKLFTGDQLNGEKLFNVLDKLANDPTIDFSKPVDKIREALAQKPEYAAFVQDTNESRALTATISAFAKTHAQVMANLELRRNANGTERAAIVKRLDDLRVEKNSFLTNLRDIARTAKLEERVRRAYRESLLEVRSLNRRLENAQSKITAADVLSPILSKEHAELAGKLAIGADAVFRDGMAYNVPPTADASRDDILKSTKKLALDTGKGTISNPEEVEEHLRQMAAFINAREAKFAAGDYDAKDDIYNGIKRQFEEIAANKNFKINVGPAQKWMLELNLSPVGARMRDGFGTPAARMIDQMINRYTSEQMRMKPEAERIGRRNDQLEDSLLKLLPSKLADARNYLRDNFLNPAKRLMQHQDDLEERFAGNPTGLKTAIYNRVMAMLLNNESTRPHVRGNEAAWREGIQNLLEFQHESNKYFLREVQASGLGVTDPRLQALNPATGKNETAVRQHIPQGAYTFSQKLSNGFRIMANALRNSGWAGEGETLAKDDFKKIAELYNSGPDGAAKASQLVNKYFNHEQHGDQVRNQFFRALAEMDTESPFDAPSLSDGVTRPPADVAKVMEAYQRSKGDPLKFAEAMWDLHDGKVVHGQEGQPDLQNKGMYVQSTMMRLAEIAHEAHNILNKVEPIGTDRTIGVRGMTANTFIDARSIDHLPGQWFDYHTFDQRDTFKTAERIASQAAFGREQERLGSAFDTVKSEVKAAQLKLSEGRAEVLRSNPLASPKELKAALVAKFGKEEYGRLEKFNQRARMVQSSVNDLSTYFRRDNAPDGTLQALTRASNTLGTMIINQPSSALALMTQLVDMNLRFGASRSTLGATFRSVSAAGREIAGSLAQAVGLQMFNGGEYHRLYNELGLNDPAAIKTWRDAFDRLEGESAAAHTFRAANDLLGTGLNRLGDKAQHVVFKPGQIFNTAGEVVDKAVTEGVWRLVGKQVMRGMDFYRSNLEMFNDPTFKLSTEDLKLKGAEKDSFGRINQSLERWGLNYDDMVRGAMRRGDKTLFTNQEAARIYSMTMSEIALESNISTMPASAYNNSLVRIALPLLGWSFRRMQQVSELRLNAEGRNDLQHLARGLGGLSVVALGGLAASALIDQYYQRALGKQRNLRPLTNATSPQDAAMSVMENLNRVGTIGLWGELANGLVNVGQGGDNRMLSVDGRVLAVSSFQSVQQAISAWINQGYNADYAHVVRPFLGAVGGGGLIQYMQLANNSLGLDDMEARITARINAQNYLRVVGRELGMDVRTSDGGTFTPSPITPFMTQMELAAYKNSPGDFREAYTNAVSKARELGKDDPVDFVKRSFSTRNPLRAVFSTSLTQPEYERLLANMPGSGQQDVSQAVNLFNQYAESIGARPFDGKKDVAPAPGLQSHKSFRLGPSLSEIRQRAALALQ